MKLKKSIRTFMKNLCMLTKVMVSNQFMVWAGIFILGYNIH